ncbi:MAG: molybdopterin-dependent oxidoreductase [Anaerolineaceae bacterium]|nr:molybdopterin-dependent oxidoreductase [Anaerolineaceae bacterium]
MPHKKLGITLFSLIVLFALALSACGAPAAAPAPAVEEEAPAAEPILEIVGTDQTLSFSMAELQALPAAEGQAGMISSTGAITPPIVHKGISLKDLVELLGGMDKSMGLYVEAVDGYGITFSYDQVMSGDFITYDPVTGIEISVEGPLTAILAYERDGKAMDPVQDGQLRVVAVGPEADNLIDGHWAVKWVNYLELKSVAANWFLHLEGVLTEEMDRAAFESGSSPHCHLKSWTDENGDEWMGIPLWYLVGRVDDEVRHEGRAFDEDLAEAGYVITVTAADGYSVELASQDASFNDEWIVAAQVNGEPLSDKNYPLRLVGEGLSTGQMVGAVESIVLDLEAQPETTAAPETPPPAADPAREMEGDLIISGVVDFVMPFQFAELQDMDVVTINTKHPKKDEMVDYRGVRLNDLLAMAKPRADAKTVKLIASDGYAIEVPLADVLACADCLIAFDDDGSLKSVMPGMDSMFWVKDVVSIEIQ